MPDTWWQLVFIFVRILCVVVMGHSDLHPGRGKESLADFVGGSKTTTVFNNFCPAPCSCLGEYLECKKQNLREVPLLPEWVRSLELPGNKLDNNVENSIGNLTELKSLNLKKNQILKMPIFRGLISLEKLNLAHNKIEIIAEEALLLLPRLKELDLIKNRIKAILPNAFPVRNQLSTLNLNGNQIDDLPETTFDHLGNLVELHLSHNRLKTLPHDVFKSLVVLKKLDLSGNDLNITWAIFRGLDQLRVLKLRSNRIEYLPDGVFQALKSILTIELDSNRITSLNRSGFFNLETLTSLSLSNNSIRRLQPETWEFIPQLVSLDLSSNNLTEISRHNFKCLAKLKRLHLQRNQIKYIDDGSFTCIGNLEFLDLSGNRLPWTIEGTAGPFSILKRLETLELKDNEITSINKKAFLGLESLESLNLDGNNITTIQFNAFEPLKRIEKLILNSSHFLCDCNLQWLFDWLKTRSRLQQAREQSMIVCDYPESVRGKELLSLKNDEDFMCNESPKPRLIKEPSNQLAIKGRNLTLECSAISSVAEEMSFQWRRDNFDVRSNEIGNKTHTVNNNTITSSFLHLSSVNRGHNGKYQCVVSNSFGSAYSQRFKITVATYPVFLTIPSNVTLKTGSTARLDCSAYGEPMPQIAWQKDGGNDFPAARERRMLVMPEDNAFFIMTAKSSDMGVYTCTAANPAGIIQANATLTVHETPSFKKPADSTKEIVTGKSGVLECMARGSPKPKLRWLKDEKPLKLTDRHFFAAGNQLLIITETIPTDAGIYKCEIENELGLATTYQTLKISKSISKAIMNTDEMTGIIIITVFCCTVGTSIIWVVIIYHTKKGNECNTNGNYGGGGNNDFGNISGVSPIINPTMNAHSRFLIQQQQQQQSGGGIAGGDRFGVLYQLSNGSAAVHEDCLSNKDSGTGDSAKRSQSADDLTLNLNDSYSSNSVPVDDSFDLAAYNQKISSPPPPPPQSTTIKTQPSALPANKSNPMIAPSLSMQHVRNGSFNNNNKAPGAHIAEQFIPLIVRSSHHCGNDKNSIPSSNCNNSSETSMSV